MEGERGTGRVMWPQPPAERQSLLGWIAVTAHENVLPSPYTILRRAGLSYTAKPVVALLSTEAAGAFAAILGGDKGEVESRMLRPGQTPTFVSLNGAEVRRKEVATSTRRFSPATLRRTGTHLATWMLHMLPFCPESWEFLQDNCEECGEVQRWRHAQDQRRCDACNADLTAQRAETVDPSLRDSLSDLAAVAHGSADERRKVASSLPPALAMLSPGALLDLTSLLAGVVDPDLSFSFPARTELAEQRRVASAYAQAWRLVQDFPASLAQVLARLTAPNVPSQARAARIRAKAILEGKMRLEVLPEVRGLISNLKSSGRTILTPPTDDDLRVKPAAWILGATEGEVADARDACVLRSRPVLRSGAVRSGLDRAEIEYLGDVRTNRVATHAVAVEFGLPRYAAEQLLASGLVNMHDHAWLVGRYGGPQVTHADLAAFKSDLRQAQARCELQDAVTLANVMRRIGGGPKPWGRVLRMLKEKEIPFVLENDRIAPTGISIPDRAAAAIRALGMAAGHGFYTQEDAIDILNLSAKDRGALAGLQGTRSGSGWRLPPDEVEDKARLHISMGELIARTGMANRTIGKIIREKGLGPRGLYGWDRASVEAALAPILR